MSNDESQRVIAEETEKIVLDNVLFSEEIVLDNVERFLEFPRDLRKKIEKCDYSRGVSIDMIFYRIPTKRGVIKVSSPTLELTQAVSREIRSKAEEYRI